jgi:membrane-bound lytic murein transglycosylase D
MPDVTEKVADNSQLSLAPEVALKRSTVKAGRADTVVSLAKKYKTTPANIAEWNKVSSNASFKPGQAVVLYLPARTKAPVKDKASASTKPVAKGKAASASKKTSAPGNKGAASGKSAKPTPNSKKKQP